MNAREDDLPIILWAQVKSGCRHLASPQSGTLRSWVQYTPTHTHWDQRRTLHSPSFPESGFSPDLGLRDLDRLNGQPVPGFAWFCPYGRVPGVVWLSSFHRGAVALNSEPLLAQQVLWSQSQLVAMGFCFCFCFYPWVVASLMECKVAAVTWMAQSSVL